jgi:hypothetical protein
MNAIFLSHPNKSLRQITRPSYNHGVENHAQAPQRRVFHFSSTILAFTRAAKPRTFSNLHTLEFDASATHSFASTSPLFEKHGGCTPELPILEPPPCGRVRCPERRPFQLLLAPLPLPVPDRRRRAPIPMRDINRPSASGPRFSLARKKQSAPHSTETHLRPTTLSEYSLTRSTNLQETHR